MAYPSNVNDPKAEAADLAASTMNEVAVAREHVTQGMLQSGQEAPLGYFPPVTSVASTRVRAFRYVPDDPSSPGNGTGTIFVQFIKGEDGGDRYAYPHVPFGTYVNFQREGVSKGKFINAALNSYPYRKAVGNDLDFFSW
ncbi:MAG: hypothetical protein CL724_11690 [Chloroflexi bacterium]|nr:hypothetical protein [Chloroflexota bacterium]|tara:strand:+ start:653 stop:1072 length:420 start_codon:yes stop_codon:yes gene_type:complete